MGRFLLEKVVPFLIAPLYWLLYKTWRIREVGPSEILQKYVRNREPCLFAHWHGDELVLVGYYSFRNLAVLSSLSKDGTIMANTLSLLGYQVHRGSSSKGGARGLIALIKDVKQGSQAALAVDGPKGPIYEAKAGIIELGVRTGKPIIPVRARAKSAWFIPRAWNKSYIPKLFTSIEIEYGQPLSINELSQKQDLQSMANEITLRLNGMSGIFLD